LKSYIDLLKHPLWQRKRLEVLNSKDWTCEACGSVEKCLHVHHKKYVYGRNPWEYELKDLSVLCEDCHAEVEWFKKYDRNLEKTMKEWLNTPEMKQLKSEYERKDTK
jgi:5-methylcytosine-specific restriction endonuclease McrA